jgi:hypothetical protein
MRQRKAIAADEDAATNSRVAKSSINREVRISACTLPVTDMMVEFEGKMHKIMSRGIRDPKGRVKGHRVEIRPAGSSTKIWVGTFSTREKAKRAYDVALYITGKDAYYYEYPRGYFPERKSAPKPQYVKDMAKEYAEKTEKFPVNPLSLIMGHVSLVPETATNSPCSPEDSLVTTQAADSVVEILKCDVEEPLASSDKSPESLLSWWSFEMDQPAVGFKHLYPEDLQSFLLDDDYSLDENFMAQVLDTPPPIVFPSMSSEEYDFDKIAKTSFESDNSDQKSTAIIDQGLNESQPQLNLFNLIEDGGYYLPMYPVQDQKRMRTMCDTKVEELWNGECVVSSSSVDNLFNFPSIALVSEGDQSIYRSGWV